MSTSEFIKEQRDGRVLELILDRPRVKNALTLDMYEALSAGLDRAGLDESVRAVILRSSGADFTSGNDLSDFMQNPPTDESSPVFGFLKSLVAFPKPLLAAVDGYAVGIGTTMLFHCDLVYAASSARFQLPFINLAVVPEGASSVILPRMLGHQRAAELLYFGDRFDAAEAHRLGIVNAVCAPEELLGFVRERAQVLAAKAPAAMLATKRLVRQAQSQEIEEALVREAVVFADRLQSPELAEAIGAFFEKRKPNFG